MSLSLAIRRSLVVTVLATLPLSLAAQDRRPRILVTNDDGIGSRGIAAIADALRAFADVVVVAPAENHSGGSHSTVIRGIRAEVTPFLRDGRVFGYGINATPADAAKFGILHFGATEKFDLVVSGINAGANTGNVAHSSGTVGAGMEALYQGIPAIASSQDAQQDYALSARITVQIVKQILQSPLPPGVMLSINVPRGALKGIKAAPMGGSYFGVGGFQEVERKGETVVYRSIIRGANRDGDHNYTTAYLDGYVTVTPLRFDWTDSATLKALQGLNLSLEAEAAVGAP